MKVPNYFGGMILSDMDTAYDYENWLVSMLKYRYKKYSAKWHFFVGMDILLRDRIKKGLYKDTDFHIIPRDPLIHMPEECTQWLFLSLMRRKLKILEFEVMKYYRRHKNYPMYDNHFS